MRHRTVGELMSRDVVRARPDTPLKEIVRLLEENDVTAVPVVDELDRPVGVVPEADLLRKGADRTDPSGRIPVPRPEAWERARAEGARAEELMSAPAVRAARADRGRGRPPHGDPGGQTAARGRRSRSAPGHRQPR
ncbi:hypothetical protein GCM10009564_13260 [Streptomyces thermogriseus]|jgi:CBS domain-containing protein|uniref:CBS domain-containing protein n=1 Tax=Streptomyces thermogriseus TaxID=75292 RepID=A0ABP4DCJ5_9ACTN